jgi:signal transduction histidine kinase/CheY-like chemotaxis protein
MTTPLGSGAGPAATRYQQGQRIEPDELRTMFLFEALTQEQLDWIAERSRVELFPAGGTVYTEGEPATCFYVLLDGTITMSRRVAGDEVELVRSSQRGAYAGATMSFTDPPPGQQHRYPGSLHAVTDVAVMALPAEEFAPRLRAWFPMAMHLIEGMLIAQRNSQVLVGQREKLVALGSLTAGLTHELNNPAAAAVRATASLRERIAGMRHKLALLAKTKIDADALMQLVELQEDAVKRVADAPELSPLQTSDREDDMGAWLEDHDVDGAWELAPVFVAAGLTPDWMEQLEPVTDGGDLNGSVRWLAYSVETELLMSEIDEATRRISTLVSAAKSYSHMDRAGHEWVDVHEGLKSTLVIMTHRLRGMTVVKDLDLTLPKVLAYPGELNQVWTNIIDNAAAAMDGSGTLTVRTARDGDRVLVEIGDTGPGIPPDIQKRIFEPFFTTKDVGEGTGLGLATVFGIVKQSGGDIGVSSRPGRGSTFKVYLPCVQASLDAPLEDVFIGEPPGGSETILLVDDEELVRSFEREVLLDGGYTVLEASSPRYALALSSAHSGAIDLLVTDVVMPRMSGRELAEAIAGDRPGIKTLYVSGYPSGAITRHGVLEHGIAFLPKPLTRHALAHKVREVLDA